MIIDKFFQIVRKYNNTSCKNKNCSEIIKENIKSELIEYYKNRVEGEPLRKKNLDEFFENLVSHLIITIYNNKSYIKFDKKIDAIFIEYKKKSIMSDFFYSNDIFEYHTKQIR